MGLIHGENIFSHLFGKKILFQVRYLLLFCLFLGLKDKIPMPVKLLIFLLAELDLPINLRKFLGSILFIRHKIHAFSRQKISAYDIFGLSIRFP